MNLTKGEFYNVRIGSSEHPKLVVAEYLYPSSDLARFHIFFRNNEPLTIHDSNILGPHEATRQEK